MTDHPICGAKTLSGKPCQRRPAAGRTRCKLHGGATPFGPASVHFKHGRYAFVFHGQLARHYEQMSTEEDPLDVLPELGVMRSMLAQQIERISGKEKVTVADLANTTILAGDVVRAVDRIVRARNDTMLTAAEVKFLVFRLIDLSEKYVPDPNRRRAYIAELRSLLPGQADSSASGPADVPAGAETTG